MTDLPSPDSSVPNRLGMGARMVLSGSDHNLLLEAATRRAQFLRGISL